MRKFEFLTDRQLALLLSVSLPTVRKWRIRGVGPHYKKLEGSCRYSMADVESWIASRTTGGENVVQRLPGRPAQPVRLSEDERLRFECDRAFRLHEDLYD
jgi:predicted DNA-binding transcriptional regulator AlpA